jgi:hypothetical protein
MTMLIGVGPRAKSLPSGSTGYRKGGVLVETCRKHVPGAKARIDFASVMPGLKSRPISKASFPQRIEFFFSAYWFFPQPMKQNCKNGLPQGSEAMPLSLEETRHLNQILFSAGNPD